VKQEIIISTEELLPEFQNHLSYENNYRILFTAPYGTGKSTFLNEFFKKKDNYFTINLYPVNYSVSANEDVFELIKFDIILQLLEKYPEQIKLQKEEFSLLLRSQVFIQEKLKFMPLFLAILGMVGKIGQSAKGLIDAAKKVNTEFKDFSKESSYDEQKTIEQYISDEGNKKGSIYEMDDISALISDFIQRIKDELKAEPRHESVLILDDLDRLDPDHLFRLLNIFSAHHVDERNNKFGFDKIIFVGDIENIRKIFHHRYGLGIDFSGYIDKFYSLAPFDFDNRKYVREKIADILYKIDFDLRLIKLFPQTNEQFRNILRGVVNSFIDARLINLRMLLNYPPLKVPQRMFARNKNNIYTTTNSPIVVLFYFLRNFYGSFEVLRGTIDYMVHNIEGVRYNTSSAEYVHFMESNSVIELIAYCLPVIHGNEISKLKKNDGEHFFYSEKYKCNLYFVSGIADFDRIYRFVKATTNRDTIEEEIRLNPFQLMSDAFEACWKLGALV
jgi:hypothetical protein